MVSQFDNPRMIPNAGGFHAGRHPGHGDTIITELASVTIHIAQTCEVLFFLKVPFLKHNNPSPKVL